jgi:hypothetical protein
VSGDANRVGLKTSVNVVFKRASMFICRYEFAGSYSMTIDNADIRIPDSR